MVQFKEGDRVSHKIYGNGTIVEYVDDYQIYVDFDDEFCDYILDYDADELTLIENNV